MMDKKETFFALETEIKFEGIKTSQSSDEFYKILVLFLNCCKQEIFEDLTMTFFVNDFFNKERMVEIKRSLEEPEQIDIFLEGELKHSLLNPNSSLIAQYITQIKKFLDKDKLRF